MRAVLLSVYVLSKGVTPTRDLVSALGYPAHNIASTALKLKKLGYLETVIGPFGGYTLVKSPNEITIGEILTAFNDELRLTDENTPQTDGCSVIKNLKVKLEGQNNAFDEAVLSHTLADFMEEAI